MLRTKIKYENQQRAITPKKDGQSYDSCALHFSLMRSIHLCSFKLTPEIVFELCSGQKCGLRTDRPTSAKQYTPASSKEGIINVSEKLKFVFKQIENTVGKGENAGYHNVFKSLLFQV